MDAARAAGLKVLPVLSAASDSSEHLEIGYEVMSSHLQAGARPKYVFCTSDLIAYGAHRAAREHRSDLDRELVFVGFDDSPLNPWVAPWLNAVRVPYAAYGAAIVEALVQKAESIRLPHELVIRSAIAVR